MEVIGGRRSQSAMCLALNKKLIANIASAWKVPTFTICADVTNFYDRVAHPFASLHTQYFRLEITYVTVLSRAIQTIKIFLRTSYGILETFYSRNNETPF